MSRITDAFTRERERGARALVPYLTAGYPCLENTLPLLNALVAGGADVIELGVPFSDPIADGPTIQRASAEALEHGITLHQILDLVREFRKQSQTPVVLFGAYNPFLHYGLEQFARDAAAAAVDGVLIPDLPADEGDEVEPVLRAQGIDLVYLVAPTTPKSRKSQICGRGSGFIYYISLKGVTGARTSMQYELEQPLEEIRACTNLPVAVGFGITTPEQATTVARHADGGVVGSARIVVIKKNSDAKDQTTKITELIRSLKQATEQVESAAGR
jgi:tryptophan synthase alpha chain